MRFKKKRKNFLETWYYRDEKTKIVAYIYFTPKTRYYYSISSLRSTLNISYSSLQDNITFNTFKDVKESVENWWSKNIKLLTVFLIL